MRWKKPDTCLGRRRIRRARRRGTRESVSSADLRDRTSVGGRAYHPPPPPPDDPPPPPPPPPPELGDATPAARPPAAAAQAAPPPAPPERPPAKPVHVFDELAVEVEAVENEPSRPGVNSVRADQSFICLFSPNARIHGYQSSRSAGRL